MNIMFWKKEKPKEKKQIREETKTLLKTECEKSNRPDLYQYLQYVPYFPDKWKKGQETSYFHSGCLTLYEGLRLEAQNNPEAIEKFEKAKQELGESRQKEPIYARDAEEIIKNFDDVIKILRRLWKID
ncbi:MAG: hypothetical protein QXU74_00195 [Candidatus Aenigmatarchaeota archaeon]